MHGGYNRRRRVKAYKFILLLQQSFNEIWSAPLAAQVHATLDLLLSVVEILATTRPCGLG